MALSVDGSRTEAQAIASVCNELAGLLAKVDVIIEHNSDLSIDWAANINGTPDPETGFPVPPAYIAQDAQGNINGLLFDRRSVADAVGSLAQFRNLMTNQAASTGDHLGNINKLANPMPLRS